ncbi:MAG TPA: hypothetical protein VKD71_12330, partial [Gemmataceae bacterium]|nr:hypothetical protein [Gemmataceae bacterium]
MSSPAETSPTPAQEVQAETPAPKTSGPSASKDGPFAPMVEVQKEDYSEARNQFRTRLTRRGPSPQPFDPLKPPTGVTEIEYPSGELRLKAWLSHSTDDTRKHPAI